MWVLSERENAEKVGYPVVWEEIKDASNVIDYQINEEITKDASGVINANNQTTTGMATVIPWINAPKLIAETSIIWDIWSWGWMSIVSISDYLSADEWQPVVERVLAWELVCVVCKFTAYSNLQNFYFFPAQYLPDQALRFCCVYARNQWFRINCWVTWTHVDSVTAANWSM